MINEFRGKYFFLSNFYNIPVTWEGITYQNNEAAFQSAKVIEIEQRKKFCNLDPSSAKRKGRHVELRNNWETIKFDIMYQIVKCKFIQNGNIRAKLLETNNQELVEGNNWHDNMYGTCYCDRCKNVNGKNMLGKILMKIREELREM